MTWARRYLAVAPVIHLALAVYVMARGVLAFAILNLVWAALCSFALWVGPSSAGETR